MQAGKVSVPFSCTWIGYPKPYPVCMTTRHARRDVSGMSPLDNPLYMGTAFLLLGVCAIPCKSQYTLAIARKSLLNLQPVSAACPDGIGWGCAFLISPDIGGNHIFTLPQVRSLVNSNRLAAAAPEMTTISMDAAGRIHHFGWAHVSHAAHVVPPRSENPLWPCLGPHNSVLVLWIWKQSFSY